ncbi:hypothetical protein [Sphingomonas montana]|uniref:hypothetical protein n=1 Tax=Sphingomonas montana TaxID=1843236 RepID=UPI001F0A0F42|nr:hypothetical protein [Sphingomonas montana]
MKTRLPLALSAALLIVACDRSPPPQPEGEPYNETVTEVTPAALPEPEPEQLPADEPVTAEPATAAIDVPPPPEVVPPDDQMMEDAEATGMTARVSRGEEAETQNAPVAEGQ